MSASASPMPAGQVLIVDDNLQNLELLEAYLEELPGVRVLRSVSGPDALEQVRRHHPDLVLLDIMMPRMSGFEVCKQLKADPATRDVAIIMVTALNEVSDVERSVECGADDFLSKPVNRKDLLARINGLLQARRRRSSAD